MTVNHLSMQLRKIGTKGSLNRIRKEGLVPGVVYGGDKPNTFVQFDRKNLGKILKRSGKGTNALIELKVPGEEQETVMIRDLQWNVLTGALIHADFYRVSLSQPITAEVPLTWIGEPIGVKKGGLMQPGLRSVLVECLPAQIPERLEVAVADLNVGDKLTVADLQTPPGVKILEALEEVIVSILSARVEEEPSPPPEEKREEIKPPAVEVNGLAAK